MASHPAYADYEPESDSGAFFKAAAVLLGIAVGIVGFFALMLWSDARNARDDAQAASAVAQPAAQEHAGALPLNKAPGAQSTISRSPALSQSDWKLLASSSVFAERSMG